MSVPRLRALPISARLALWYALTLLLLLSGFAVFCYLGFHAAAHRSFDRHLDHELSAIAPLLQSGRADALDASAATRLDGPSGTFVRVLSPDGAVQIQSANFDGKTPLGVVVPSGQESMRTSREWSGEPVRSLVRPFGDGYVEVSGIEWSRHQELRDLGQMLMLGVGLSVLFALGAGWWLARRALRPVAVLTEAAGQMADDGARLGARLPAAFETRDELTHLAETFNELLARLEASVARERRFTANAAHELMTPIATLRSEAEVALRRERDGDGYREVLGRVVEDAGAMTATVQGLLELARAESLARTPEARLDLGSLVRARAERVRIAADAKGITLDLDVDGHVRVAAEAGPLAQVADNLLSNAVKYTPPGGRVTVSLHHMHEASGAGTARLEVSDTGPGFDEATCGRLFDRFFRADTPEVQAEAGSGLGLAIVKAIAEGLGGRVGCESGGLGLGATFWMELPCVGTHAVASV